MSSDAEDASDSSESAVEEDSATMTDDKADRASSEEKPAAGGTSENKDNKPASKSKAKDADRPKRKKARRACYACQRAHLTCGLLSLFAPCFYTDHFPGDERPCFRCIKRGLSANCQDGVRKKAKYLHDAPAEALVPGFGSKYNLSGSQPLPSGPANRQMSSHTLPVTHPGNFYPSTTSYPQFSGQMAPSMIENANPMGDYSSQNNVETPIQFYSSPSQISPVQAITTSMGPSPAIGNTGNPSFEGFIDPNETALMNFNFSDSNFDNHYGAMEFGMLGHMSSGAANTSELDAIGSLGQPNRGSVSYDNTGFVQNYGFNQPLQTWQTIPRQSSTTQLWSLNNQSNNGLDAFAVGDGASSVAGASDYSQGHELHVGRSSNAVSPEISFAQPDDAHQTNTRPASNTQVQKLKRKQAQFPSNAFTQSGKKRRRNTSDIYNNVTKPHPYTQGFHNLTAFLTTRFPTNLVVRIAKALASFRPSFISCNKNLTTDDLVFMEKCFQRTLYEYEDFLDHYGTPTLICRRTGEVATVSKEFSLVTGWHSDVLLGKAPNLNVNTGDGASGTATGSTNGASTKGTATPRNSGVEIDPSHPQPVFLAELMDQDSVVQFYEDFAELAFGASRSSIIGARCTLHKYKTKDDPGWSQDAREEAPSNKEAEAIKPEPLMKGEAGTNTLGNSDGKVEAVLCWTVKRDVFDIPMMIVLNVSILRFLSKEILGSRC